MPSKNRGKTATEIQALLKANQQGVKIDLGCGADKQPGFIGIDHEYFPGVDIVHDFSDFPWPLPDDCAGWVHASHLVEHINPADGGFLKFMDEVWRIMKPDGLFTMALPYAGSPGYWQDPTHVNGCNQMTWAYFDPVHKEIGDGLYRFYRPKPWKEESCVWQLGGNMEVALRKRRLSNKYGHKEKK